MAKDEDDWDASDSESEYETEEDEVELPSGPAGKSDKARLKDKLTAGKGEAYVPLDDPAAEKARQLK